MAAAAVIGVCLSAIGVGLVWTTFRETKDANVIARNAMIGQLRPWIKISAKQMGQIRVNEDELSLKIQCKFENKGESPAINFCYHTTMYFEDMTSKQLASDIKGWFNEESNSFDEVNIFRNDDEVRDCEVEHSGRVTGEFSVNLVVAARYQSAFSPEYHYTAIMLRIVNVSSGRFLFATLGPNHTSLHRIELRPRENFAGIAT